jgi:hypothetical protein
MESIVDDEPASKKRKRISSSRGGHKFQIFSGRESKNSSKKKIETDLEIMAWITNICGQCCSKVPENETCCLLQKFKRSTGEFRFQVRYSYNL